MPFMYTCIYKRNATHTLWEGAPNWDMGVPTIGAPQNGWLLMENPTKLGWFIDWLD